MCWQCILLFSSFLLPLSGVLSLCLSSRCWNKIPQPEWLMNNRYLFLTVLEAGGPRSGCQQVRILERPSLGCLLATFSRCPPVEDSGEEANSLAMSLRALTPSRGLYPHELICPYHFPKAPPPNASLWGWGGVSTYKFWSNTDIQSMSPFLHFENRMQSTVPLPGGELEGSLWVEPPGGASRTCGLCQLSPGSHW